MDGQIEQLKQERLRRRWTASQDKIFVDLVVEQIQLGNRTDNVFDQKAWKHIQDQFNAVTGLNFNKKQLRKHLDVLRTRYHNLKSASEQRDFNLEHSGHMLMIPEYELFEDLMQEVPKSDNLKIKDCPIYEQLCMIFTEPICDGRYAESSHFGKLEATTTGLDVPRLRSGPETTSTTPKLSLQTNASSRATGPNKNVTNGRKRGQSGNPSSPQNTAKQDKLNEAMGEALLAMITASKLRAGETTQSVSNPYSITNCIKALDEIQDIGEGLYFAAIDIFDDSCKREMFLSLKRENRLAWLRHTCKNDLSL